MSEVKLSQIKLLLLDVDGVLTDGRIYFDHQGEELKAFNSKDGLGIHFLMESGIQVGVITARQSNALQHRCENLGLDLVFQGMRDKAAALAQIQEQTGVSPNQMAYMGDDVLDLPMFTRVGLAIAVADAHPTVLKQAHLVTSAKGGKGAVREICDAILTAQGLMADILERYTR